MLFDIELRTLGIGRSSDDEFTSLASYGPDVYAAGSRGLFKYSPEEQSEQAIILPTIDLRREQVIYLSHAILLIHAPTGGSVFVGTELDNDYTYPILASDELKEIFVRFGRGFKGRLYTIKIVGIKIALHSAAIFIERVQRRRR